MNMQICWNKFQICLTMSNKIKNTGIQCMEIIPHLGLQRYVTKQEFSEVFSSI